jgi:molybdopterin synthase catalytic subunit
MAVISRLQAGPFDAAAELRAFMAGRTQDGAVVSFTGLARGKAHSGDEVQALVLDHYPGMTERSIEEIAEAGAARFEVSDVLVVHRHGRIAPGEPIVFVATASRHRGEAFACADYLMDRLKTEAAFWKREEGQGAPRWIEPTEADRQRRARWSD